MAALEAMLQQQQFDVALEELARGVDTKTPDISQDDLDEADMAVNRSQSQWLRNNRGRRSSVATYTSHMVYPLSPGTKTNTPCPPASPAAFQGKPFVRQRHTPGTVSAVQTWLAHQGRNSAQDLGNSSEARQQYAPPAGPATSNAVNISSRHKKAKPRYRWPTVNQARWRDQLAASLSTLNNVLPMFNPFSTGRRCWELAIMLIVLYNAVSVPLDISYGMPDDHKVATYLEYALDLVFTMDIISNFRTAYVDATGHLVRDARPIAVNYLKLWFWIDLFATIPYDLLVEALFKGQVNKSQVLMLKILRTPRLLRLGRLMRILDRFKAANMIRVFMVVCAMSLISHWLACIWYMLYKFTSYGDYTDWAIFLSGDILPDATLSAYLSAYYQSFLMMVGNNQEPFNNIERIFMILVMIIGACFYSAMVGQMAVLVANLNAMALRHRQKQDTTLDVLRYLGLPTAMLARVQAYFTYITAVSHPAAEGLAFLTELPKALLDQVTTWLYRTHLEQVPLFNGLDPAFLSSLALRMRIVTFTPKETIFRAGDLGHDMYIIRKGCVAVVGKNNELMNVLCAGAHFGDLAMFTMSKRTAKCVALSNCDLAVLNTYDLKIVMKDFPQASETLQIRTEEEIRNLQVAGRAGLLQEELDDPDWLSEPAGHTVTLQHTGSLPQPPQGGVGREHTTSAVREEDQKPIRPDSAQHLSISVFHNQQTAYTAAPYTPTPGPPQPTAEGVHQADILIAVGTGLSMPSAWQGNYTPRIDNTASVLSTSRNHTSVISSCHRRNRYAGSTIATSGPIGEAADKQGTNKDHAELNVGRAGLPPYPLLSPGNRTAAGVRAISNLRSSNDDAKMGLQGASNNTSTVNKRNGIRSSIDLLFEAAGFTVPLTPSAASVEEHADLIEPSMAAANVQSVSAVAGRSPVISGPCCVWRNAIAAVEENNDTPFCLWVRAGASNKGGRVYHASVAHTKDLRQSLECDVSSSRGSTKARSDRDVEHGLLRHASQHSRSSINCERGGGTNRQLRRSRELLSPGFKQPHTTHTHLPGKLTPRSTAAEALMRSQEEVRQLRGKLENLQELGAQERKQLFRQTLGALHLVEGLMQRVGDLEGWVDSVGLELTKVMASQHQAGAHQNILGVHLEEPGLNSRQSTNVLAHAMSVQMRPMSVSSPNLQNELSSPLKTSPSIALRGRPSILQPSIKRPPAKQPSRLMGGQPLQDPSFS